MTSLIAVDASHGMEAEGWISDETGGCHFDLAIGFAAEWKAMEMPFAVVDLETTGSSPLSGELLEFAAILVKPTGAITAELSVLVRISAPVPDFIKAATGITQANVDCLGLPLSKAMQSFVDFIGSRAVFIHNADFDLAFLRRASEQTQVTFANQVHDTQIMAILAWAPSDCDRITALAQHVGAAMTGSRAIDHAKATLAVLLAIREEASRNAFAS